MHLTPRDLALLGEGGAAVAHCPTSNLFLGSGLCHVNGLRDAGVRVGIGTNCGGRSSY